MAGPRKPEIAAEEYVDANGVNAFGVWVRGLDTQAFVKVARVVARMRLGNLSDVKPVGEGVSERRIDFGPGYRIYFAKDGKKLIILLGGGTKKRQQKDIEAANAKWAEYKKRKKGK